MAIGVSGTHEERIEQRLFCRGDALRQPLSLVEVHEKSDGAAIHAVDRYCKAHEAVQRLDHESIAAESNDNIRLVRRDIAVGSR